MVFPMKILYVDQKFYNQKESQWHQKPENSKSILQKKIGVKYALMVNSGSSANLLATFTAGNLLRNNHFKRGDEVLIPVFMLANIFMAASTIWIKT